MDRYKTILEEIEAFNTEREWGQFHKPKDLSMAISIEAAELLQLFLWKTEIGQVDIDKAKEEVGDIAIFLVTLSQKLDFDLLECMRSKLEINREKYPVNKARGSAKKYNEL